MLYCDKRWIGNEGGGTAQDLQINNCTKVPTNAVKNNFNWTIFKIGHSSTTTSAQSQF
jgi:hypothetical protein